MNRKRRPKGRGGPGRNQGRNAEPGEDKLVSVRFMTELELAYLMNASPRERMLAVMKRYAPLPDDEVEIRIKLNAEMTKAQVVNKLQERLAEMQEALGAIEEWKIKQ